MKRVMVYTMLLISLFLVTACRSNEINDKEGEYSRELYYQSEQYCIAPSEFSKKDMNRPEENTEWLKSLVIRYPQIYNWENNQKQSRINKFLYNKVMSYHSILSESDYINYSLDYKIMSANDDILSILFYGEVADYKTSNRFAFATTLNLKSEKEALLEDYIIIKDSFVEDFLFSRFYIVENNFDDVRDNLPFIEQFVLTYNENAHVNDFYIKDNTIGIIVPTHNSMGYIFVEGD